MKTEIASLATRLASALGKDAVQDDTPTLATHAVDGLVPSVRVAPTEAGQIGEVLKICGEAGAAVVPWGGGTAMRLGNLPARVDVALSLERLHALVEHDDANLTATVQAGMRLATLQQRLARGRQFLALDPPRPDQTTVGGIVAANLNGPRRMLYGGVRDQLIGIKAVLPGGEEIKAGGKVVKNVAGYDMCKLFTGSLGTLGVITEVTFRMAPLLERASTVLASGTYAQVWDMVARIHESVLLPAAISVINAAAASKLTTGAGSGERGADNRHQVAVWIEGFAEAVERHLRDLQSMATAAGVSAEILEGASHERLWERIRDFGSSTSGTLLRLAVPIGAVRDVTGSVDQLPIPPQQIASQFAGGPGTTGAQTVAHAGAGTVWVLIDAGDARAWFTRLSELATSAGGHAIIAAAPPSVKAGLDVWGPSPSGFAIMREVKRQFDPAGVLNPGRFAGRL